MEQHRPPGSVWTLGFTLVACYLQGMRAGLGTMDAFCFRVVFSCWLQSLFA